ncbi:bifunctional isocitrate dehydrogenase kinase/phosphatase [Aliamphritea ceti]|uniref:bifunctional isocitrate dehydrogenase kinase/phosphatase n=1 Tax=Aliamphritea ceti TaxID=1524258 RepID=UPI0021C4758A|nr:bifunctional isocitrate dehydrogenase kinase/phosphatase [Aliamphritea ceti]
MSNTSEIALQILNAFIEYRQIFQSIAREAKDCFEQSQWRQLQDISSRRIDLYALKVREVANQISVQAVSGWRWSEVKKEYAALVAVRADTELAETFFNSVYSRIEGDHPSAQAQLFIPRERIKHSGSRGVYRQYLLSSGIYNMLRSMLDDCGFNIGWENRRRDICNLMRYMREQWVEGAEKGSQLASDNTVDVIHSLFFRNKAAYLVGRLNREGKQSPFVIALLLNEEGKLYVDTAVSHPDQVSVIFSFTRAYFLVDAEAPVQFIEFLHQLIPLKSRAELYNSIGFYKQGKAEFYRDFMKHLSESDDVFCPAEGIKGMVMTVFTLPSYPVVFKIIKDRFSSSKQVSRAVVKDRYALVKHHDRAGRLADTQEFVNLQLPLARFDPELLTELEAIAGSSVESTDDQLLIKHVWVERRMTPLNMYLQEALQQENEEQLFHGINEFGKCIKELAAANIFAGDMLFKNFGVTRHGRIVFYDYDEIMYLTACNFRHIPEAMYPEQELADEPWYSVGPADVFPEEFNLLTACDRKIRKLFNELHSELLTVEWWQKVQKQVEEGDIVDLYPYRRHQRFER